MAHPAYSFRLIYSEEDEGYIATCPEFDGVSGIGANAAKALAEARVALELAVESYEAEGWPLPAPSALVQSSGQFRLRLPRSLHAQLAQRAADEGMSLNSYAACLIASGLGAMYPKTTRPRVARVAERNDRPAIARVRK